jgi:8-oxo-dGTP pyrophosphatase MutT (NUDIX family)
MAAKELKERKRRREQEERPLPAEQMDADEAGFIHVGVNSQTTNEVWGSLRLAIGPDNSMIMSGMLSSIPEFGSAVTGQTYVLRPGSYGVIRNGIGSIAVVLTPQGVFLPGGGQELDESAEAALIREVAEECGLAIHVMGFVGVADELVFSQEEQSYFRKRCSFFAAEAQSGSPPLGGEPSHQLSWLAPDDAVSQLSHGSQKWAVRVSGATA